MEAMSRAQESPRAINWDWEDVRMFLGAATSPSLSAAARLLGVGQATVSRRIASLEERLGYPLFTRSVEGVELTAAGAALLSAARTMEDGALAFGSASRGTANELSGRVRITAPPGVAVDLLAPFAVELSQRHPNLRLEVLSSVAQLDLSRGEADIAFRAAAPRHPELFDFAQGSVSLGVYACNAYRTTLPKRPPLASLRWVGWSSERAGMAPEQWLRSRISNFDPVFTADDFLVLQSAVAHGLGAILLPDVQAKFWPQLERISLCKEDERRLPMSPIHIVIARAARHSPRVLAVADFLVEWTLENAGLVLQRSASV